MSLLQLDPPLPMITPKGKAWSHVLIDYGPEADLLWVCFQDDTGECWTWPNKDVRMQVNISLGRRSVSEVAKPGDGNQVDTAHFERA